MKSIITIGRQYGCGGRQIGQALSERLNIPFYDKELIEYAVNQSGINAELLEQYDEKATNSLLYSLSISTYSYLGTNATIPQMPINDQLYLSQSEAIKKLADTGPCIILGRCSDFVLRDRDDVLNVFLHCDFDLRVDRISEKFGIPKAKAKDLVKKTDKRRATYYNYYTHRKWGVLENFDLSINSRIGIDAVVDLIESYYRAN